MSTVRRSQGRVHISAAAGLARSDTAAAGIFQVQGARATEPFAQPDTPTRDALLHIGREAVTNAVRHSRCDAVEVTLADRDESRLTVRANGRGCGPDNERRRHHTSASGFGLASMRRSEEGLGGSLRVRSAVGGDTIVEALLP
jgi:signal transduction histidine kinase